MSGDERHRRVVEVEDSFVRERDDEWERKDYVNISRGWVPREESDAPNLEVDDTTPEFEDKEDLQRFEGLRLSVETLRKESLMGFRTVGENVYITDLKGETIALRYDADVENVKTDFGTVTVPRADVVKLVESKDGLKAEFLGQGLIFQRAIANQIRGSRDWAVGVLEQADRPREDAPDATMYQLSRPDLSLTDVAKAFDLAGIAI